ncbi:branched-chain amino acid ABC transporter permease [Variovorax ureilyticus]|uniref:Branched-chain amino acid ABC transporter permease n=1 Tax=Variovorax ureilyticus TaxID=1836198 RepID=A0ABU8VLU8_9BURK
MTLHNKQTKRSRWLTASLIVLAAVAPFLLPNFIVFQLTLVLVYSVAIMGLILLTGFNGQFSLGHVAFFAAGAYTAAILLDRNLVSYPVTLLIAGAICFVFGFLFGFPALRLEGVYLALATFALSVATPQVLKLTPLIPFTGGVNGISLIKPEAPFGLTMSADVWIYLCVLSVTLLMLAAALGLMATRSGRALVAIRDNPIAARSMGVNISLYKTLAFGISALYAGVAGAMSAIAVQYVSPDSFTMSVSIALFVGMVLGGIRWLPGAFFGGIFIVFIPQVSESFQKGSEGIVYAVLLILLVFLMPAGLAGLLATGRKRFSRGGSTK